MSEPPASGNASTTPTATADVEASPPATHPASDDAPQPQNEAQGRGRKRSRLNMAVPDDTLAKYTLARGFLIGEWLGALLIVASFTLLYVLYAEGYDPAVVLGISLALGLVGAAAFWRSRRVYRGLDFNYAPKWEVVANLVAASGAIFWLLFGILLALFAAGIPVLPTGT